MILTDAQRQALRGAIGKGVGPAPKKEVFFVDRQGTKLWHIRLLNFTGSKST
jgi:hypothetical protein